MIQGRRIKLRYAHPGGHNPPIIVIHGNQTNDVPSHYTKYLEKTFRRVGGMSDVHVDVRVIAATNRDLAKLVRELKFREDLYFRLNVVTLQLPPLRERGGDIVLLAEYFLRRISREKLRPPLTLSEDALQMLEAYAWPGNVRELENTLRRAAVLAATDVLLPKDIPLGMAGPITGDSAAAEAAGDGRGEFSPKRAADSLLSWAEAHNEALLPWLEQELTARALERTGGNQLRAAKLLGVSRATLRKRAAGGD